VCNSNKYLVFNSNFYKPCQCSRRLFHVVSLSGVFYYLVIVIDGKCVTTNNKYWLTYWLRFKKYIISCLVLDGYTWMLIVFLYWSQCTSGLQSVYLLTTWRSSINQCFTRLQDFLVAYDIDYVFITISLLVHHAWTLCMTSFNLKSISYTDLDE
jgi:hypothetical protein